MKSNYNLTEILEELKLIFEKNEDPTPEYYTHFLHEPELALDLVLLIDAIDENHVDDERAYYSSLIFSLDVCVAQLQVASEALNKLATKNLDKLMAELAKAIASKKHSLSFWLPILNAFYEVHVELSPELKNAYLDLATEEDDLTPEEEVSHLDSIRDLINELSDLSIFDVAENFFAQSYAMPADFFADLVIDLYSIDEGQDIAVLTLLHPSAEVRDVVVAMHEQLMDSIILSSASLSRLKTIKNWYPPYYHDQFNRWIKIQRKKGVVFNDEPAPLTLGIKASEIDGSGAQGLFIHIKKNRKHRLCGLLFKQELGIKDAWITPPISARDIARYYAEAFDDSVTLRVVDVPYLMMIANHFLALTIEQGNMPDLHLLEMQEELGLQWMPEKIDVEYLIEQLGVQISPFTEDIMQMSFKRSKLWPKSKQFTESWFIENPHIDKLVNHRCTFVDGVKVCKFDEAIKDVFAEELEVNRERWLFHFLLIALWVKANHKKNEKIWQDSFFIAYAIHNGMPLDKIPIMYEICYQSVVNSIETMQERRTHLIRQ